MVSETAERHTHEHGDHTHDHSHPIPGVHVHGWHSPVGTCSGDDTFGLELTGPKNPAMPAPVMHHGRGDSMYQPVIPFVRDMLKPGVSDAVANQARVYWTQDVSNTQYDYWGLVSDLWAAKEDFVLVEHDIIIPAGTLKAYEECPEPWCVNDYAVWHGGIMNTFGHAGAFGSIRFRAELMELYPTLIEDLFDRHWSHLDGEVAAKLRARGTSEKRHDSHRHYPDAVHLHDYSAIPDEYKISSLTGWRALRGAASGPEGSLAEVK